MLAKLDRGRGTSRDMQVRDPTLAPFHQAWTLGMQLWLNMAADGNSPNPVAPLPSQVVIAFTETRASCAHAKNAAEKRGSEDCSARKTANSTETILSETHVFDHTEHSYTSGGMATFRRAPKLWQHDDSLKTFHLTMNEYLEASCDARPTVVERSNAKCRFPRARTSWLARRRTS